jgi:hypothetical protein
LFSLAADSSIASQCVHACQCKFCALGAFVCWC